MHVSNDDLIHFTEQLFFFFLRHFSEQLCHSNQSWHRRHWESRQRELVHSREGGWREREEHEGPRHTKMAHKPVKRRQEGAETRGRPEKQPRLDFPSDCSGPSSSQKPRESMESTTKELATKETNVVPVVYVSSVPGKYYQWVGTEDSRVSPAEVSLCQ